MDPTAGGSGALPGGAPSSNAKQQVQAPAILLIVAAVIGILFNLIGRAMRGPMIELITSMVPPEQADQLREQAAQGNSANTVFAIFFVIGSVFILYAAFQMLKLKNWPLAMAGAVVSIVPCFGCCCIGLPVGIWALVVLNKPEVKAAFT